MSEGLVQRRRTKPVADPDDENGSNNGDGQNENDDNLNDDHESKETRLTLMEEVLLLGLKDKEG
jgi:Golgi phosphoprotein 3